MITAKDIIDLIQIPDKMFDDLILEVIVPAMRQTGGTKASVPADKIDIQFPGINRVAIIREFERRGFRVKFECEDRPCGGCWYEIAIAGVFER